MKGYVIYLSSEIHPDFGNDYGYWAGKVLYGEDVMYPTYSDNKHEEKVKVYTSKKRAETMAEKLRNRCSFVLSATVEEL